jgi:hypothetical protein
MYESRNSKRRQAIRYGRHASAVTNNHATTEELLEVMFSMRSLPRLYEENQLEFLISQECEVVAVENTQLTVSHRHVLS